MLNYSSAWASRRRFFHALAPDVGAASAAGAAGAQRVLELVAHVVVLDDGPEELLQPVVALGAAQEVLQLVADLEQLVQRLDLLRPRSRD